MKKQTKADLLLILATFFWGSSYILTKFGLHELRPFHLTAMRFIIGFFIAAIGLYPHLKNTNRQTLKYAAIFAIILTMVFVTQAYGILYTTVANAGFLISLTVIMVPIISILFLREKPNSSTLLGVLLAFIGVILLTGIESLQFNIGDGLSLLCALLYAFHILLMERVTKTVDAIALGIWQLGFTGIFNIILALIFETPTLPHTTSTWVVVLFLAIFCTAIAFVVQCYAQQYTSATHTALIFSLEPVFSGSLAVLILHEILTIRGWIGAALLLIGTLASELDVLSLLPKKLPLNKTVPPHN
ncbi:DMT family transporter [Crassaminicella profunda]|uniref:DMT family transporter n=1 Tax=Crassaminicella profunda TaxID=1286698 RepID=UPI001CA78E2E|nr:DMT family transporter [Crassaminicella profunda]QZY53916.1 DMT family transporter [Crassaminicella profunda]